MIDLTLVSYALLFSLQPIASAAAPPAITQLSQLPLEEAAAPRCGVVFAIIENAQKAGNARARQWPDMASSNGREFFVRAMARLMDDRSLDREQVAALTLRESALLSENDNKGANDLMEPCLLMKRAAGL